jgi:hypothetical protein
MFIILMMLRISKPLRPQTLGDKKMKKLLFALLIFALSSTAFGAPVISVFNSGNPVVHGDTGKIITGADFGSKTNALPLWFDDCEAATGDKNDPSVLTSPPIAHVVSYMDSGNIDYTETRPSTTEDGSTNDEYSPQYKDSWDDVAQAHPNSTTYATAGHEATASNPDCNTVNFAVSPRATAPIWYVSFRQYLPASWYDSVSLVRPNYKIAIVQDGSSSPSWTLSGPFTYWSTGDNHPYVNTGNYMMDGLFCDSYGTSENMLEMVGKWVQFEMFWDMTNHNYKQAMRHAGAAVDIESCTNCNASYDPDTASVFSIGSYGVYDNEDSNGLTHNGMKRFYDDIYMDNTFSRVVIGNRNAYADSTIIENQICTSWGASSITVTINQGAIPNGPAWAYVCDASDVCSDGEEITFGTGSSVTAAITGTVTDSIVESDIVAGGKTIIITLTNDTWVATGATFDAQRANIIAGLTSAGSETFGWNNVLRDAGIDVGDVVRTSDTVVTITLDAESTYSIGNAESIVPTVPATALTTSSAAVVATPSYSITAEGESGPSTVKYTSGGSDATYVASGSTWLIP